VTPSGTPQNTAFSLPGRTVLITGAARGIGRATALAFARAGCRLELLDLNSSGLSEVEARCRELGAPDVFTNETNVADASAVLACAARVHERCDAVDVIVNNAGVGLAGGLLDVDEGDLEWVLGVNLLGTARVIRAFVPRMIAAGRAGRIVNVASIAGLVNLPVFAAYGISKYAVVGLSEALRAELAPFHIGVCVVCPGFVDTDLPAFARLRGKRYREEDRERFREFYRRHGIAPERVADRIVTAVRQNPALLTVSRLAFALHHLKRFFPGSVPKLVELALRTRPTDHDAAPLG